MSASIPGNPARFVHHTATESSAPSAPRSGWQIAVILLVLFGVLLIIASGCHWLALRFHRGLPRRRTAHNTAIAAERAAWTEAQKADYQIALAEREKYLAGQRRFVFGVFIVMIAAMWVVGALTGG